MKRKEGNAGPKIVIGYMVLVLIALAGVAYLYNVVKQLAAEEDVNTVPRQKLYLVTNTQTLLYESEAMGQLLDIPEEGEYNFHVPLDKALENMDSLRLLSTDTLQIQKIDTIRSLIERKRQNTLELLTVWKQANDDLYAKSIKDELAKAAPKVKETEVKERSVAKQDTLIVAGRKKGFLKRLAEVFVPTEKADTNILVSANKEVLRDTVVNAYNPQDAISRSLRTIQNNVERERERLRELLVDRSSDLRFDNSLITAKINQILRDMEAEELENSLMRMQGRQDLLGRTTQLISLLALLSLFVSLFFLALIARDLFRSKYYRRQLEKEKRYTEELLAGREKLILTVSHDVRAPLSSIVGYIELLQRSGMNPQQLQYLRNMNASSSHILALVNSLLDYQRLEAGQIELHPIRFRLAPFFEEIFSAYRPLAEAKGLTLALETHGDAGQEVFESDSVRIRQILGNLLSNAIKFTETGTITLDISVEPPVKEAEDEAADSLPYCLSAAVIDTGAGIPEEKQGTIFGEFTRLEGAEKTEGFGLGLSITRKLTELLGGTISLDSEVGKGSRFEVKMPLPLSDDQQWVEAPIAYEEEQLISFEHRKATCLLVDDDLMQMALMETILQQNHLRVISCTNPRVVLEKLRSEPIDILITDIQMPGMDGYDLVKLIRSSDLPNAQTLPIVGLSATVGTDQSKFIQAGFTKAIGKPFTTHEILKQLDLLLPDAIEERKVEGLSSLTAFAGDDAEASAKILETFSIETGKNIDLLREALATADREMSARVAHKLIPLFSMLGADITVQHLRLLEINGAELSDSGWQRLMADVIRQSDDIVSMAAQLK